MSIGEATQHDEPRTAGPACPRCDGTMILRHGSKGWFYGCVRYPECTGTLDAPGHNAADEAEPRDVPFLTPDNERNIMASIILGAILIRDGNSGGELDRHKGQVYDARWYTDQMIDVLKEIQ